MLPEQFQDDPENQYDQGVLWDDSDSEVQPLPHLNKDAPQSESGDTPVIVEGHLVEESHQRNERDTSAAKVQSRPSSAAKVQSLRNSTWS